MNVDWDDDIPNWMGKYKKVPNHQPDLEMCENSLLKNIIPTIILLVTEKDCEDETPNLSGGGAQASSALLQLEVRDYHNDWKFVI